MKTITILVLVAVVTSAHAQDPPLPSLQDSLVTWSRQLRECHGEEICYMEADEDLRPVVRQALEHDELSEILPCLNGWGVYDVPTEGREWSIKANLPC